MNVLFLQTGGTIDKDYPRLTRGFAFEITMPAVKRILSRVSPIFNYTVKTVLRKDSTEITDKDRQNILAACISAAADKIIVTHGTDTMIETAEVLARVPDKVIILTGAMRPEKFSDSDAPFNVGVAIGALQVLRPGVYVAMNGRVYSWDKIARDHTTGQFVEKGRKK
ncbi:MAG TPA: asparaginase domain-containing protein [Candidatus Pristimantibacillus sp.]|nr:asparaginase domain-containing protein [Candidatus Pristimantibacillus sp.]